jgi:tyrosyl-tRNA synthetase
MPTFLSIARHSPENCDWFNEKSRKVTLELIGKLDKLLKKHGCKMLGAWSVEPSEHLGLWVIEAPTLEAFQKFGMEPEVLAASAYCTIETKIVTSLEEETKLRQQAK